MNNAGKLKIQELTFSYGSLEVIRDLSIRIDEGEIVSILGPSGCGKSTLLHLVSGLLTPDRGEVIQNGRKITGTTGHLSYMQQDDLLLPWFRLVENIGLGLKIKGLSRDKIRERVRQYLPLFGLEEFECSYPHELSGGMRQRAALLRTWLFQPDILLLDEPFRSLDLVNRLKMQNWLLDLFHEIRPTVLLVTHDIEEALRLSDRIILLSDRPAVILREFRLSRDYVVKGNPAETERTDQVRKELLEIMMK